MDALINDPGARTPPAIRAIKAAKRHQEHFDTNQHDVLLKRIVRLTTAIMDGETHALVIGVGAYSPRPTSVIPLPPDLDRSGLWLLEHALPLGRPNFCTA